MSRFTRWNLHEQLNIVHISFHPQRRNIVLFSWVSIFKNCRPFVQRRRICCYLQSSFTFEKSIPEEADCCNMDDVISRVKGMLQSGEKRDILSLALIVDAVFVFCLTICSFVVAGTANAGFNIVLTSLLNIGYIGGTYFVITNSKTPMAVSIHQPQQYNRIPPKFVSLHNMK